MSTTKQINLVDVDWNNLSVEAFQNLHKNLEIKNPKRKKTRVISGEQIVNIYGKHYLISNKLILRLKSIKSQKSKDKLISEIISTHNPVEEL